VASDKELSPADGKARPISRARKATRFSATVRECESADANMLKSLKTAASRLRSNKLLRGRSGRSKEPSRDSLTIPEPRVFTDSFGNQIELVEGLRDRLKPGWQAMLRAPKTFEVPSPRACMTRMEEWRNRLGRVSAFLNLFSLSFTDKRVVEIGAYDGATAYALTEAGASSVLATDMAAYYIAQAPNAVVSDDAILARNADLARLRQAYRAVVPQELAQRVSFRQDDICSSELPSDSADVVMSWEVLEHLGRPEDALAEIARVLTPGGFAFHEYNPFFAIDGGHSLCTLDFPWGHARLSAGDFERYLDELRPNERSVALSFYRHNLNRMSLAGLRQHVRRSGLSIPCLLPWCSERHLALMSAESLRQCTGIYPSVELADLVSPTVWVLLQKHG